MADRSVKVTVSANVQGLVSGMRTAQKATEDYAKSAMGYIRQNEQHINGLATSIGLVGVAMTAAAGIAIKRWADFDSAMSAVAATGADARANIEALTQAAIDGGAASIFTATEAATAIEALAKAGVSSADILDGGLSGALDLAAAGEIGLADAAEIAATAMNQFNLSGADVPHIADLLAASAGKAMGDVTDMAAAFKFVGPVAAQMGVSMEEAAGTIALLAQQGILGEQAGTSLRGMLTSLTSPSKIAADTMSGLGINVYDAQGKFVGLKGVAGQLKDSLGNLSEAERNQALGRIFGNEQITAARILYSGGAEAVAKWTDAVDESGYAQATAATKLDNLKGDFEALMGAIETALIGMGSGTDGMLRELVQSVTGLVDGFNDLPGPIKTAMMVLVGGGGLVALGIAGMAKLLIGISNTKVAMDGLGVSGKKAALSAGGIGTVLTVGVTALLAWGSAAAQKRADIDALADSFDRATGAASDLTRQMVVDELSKPKSGPFGIGKEADSALDQAERIGLALDTITDAAMGSSDAIESVQKRLAEINGMSPKEFANEADRLGISVGDLAESESYLGDMLDDTKGKFGEATRVAKQKSEAAGEAAKTSGELGDAEKGAAGASKELSQALGDVTGASTEADEALQKAREQAGKIGDQFFDVGDSLKKSLGEWRTTLDEQTKALRDFRENAAKALQRGADEDLVDYLVQQGPEGAAMLQQLADSSKSAMSDIGASWRGGREEIERFVAFQAGVPKEVVSEFKTAGAPDAISTAAEVARKYELTPETVETILRALDYSSDDIRAVQDRLTNLDGNSANVNVYANTDPAKAAINGLYQFANSLPFISIGVGKKQAIGGFHEDGVQRYAAGGLDERGRTVPRVPQVRNGGQGAVMWGEAETGWEAYISGKPGMEDRNRNVLSIAAGRLGMQVTKFADGGFTEAAGRLDTLRMRIRVRDLQRSLREMEEYGEPDKKTKKRKKRLRLRGLDRVEAKYELAEARQEFAATLRANKAARHKGMGPERYNNYRQSLVDQREAASSAADSFRGSADVSNLRSPAAVQRSLAKSIVDMATFTQLLIALKKKGAAPWLLGQLQAAGPTREAIRLAQQYLSDSSALAAVNAQAKQLDAVSSVYGQVTSSKQWTAPKSWSGGVSAAQMAALQRSVQVTVTTQDPSAIARQTRRITEAELQNMAAGAGV